MKRLKRNIVVATSTFLIGYMIGADHIPKGTEFLIFTCASFVSGAFLTHSVIKWRNRVNSSQRRLQMLGYELRRIEREQDQVVAPLALVESKTEEICDLCGGKEVRLGNYPIQCPKCKSGENKKVSRKSRGLA